jgi:hypothetical protein
VALKSKLLQSGPRKVGNMFKFKNRLGTIAAVLLGTWFVAVTSHHLERLVELFPLMALVAGLVEVARKQKFAHRSELSNLG